MPPDTRQPGSAPANWTGWVGSGFGHLKVTTSRQALVGISREPAGDYPTSIPTDAPDVLHDACRQLSDYLSGRLTRFDLPLDLAGTEFQLQVWQCLLEIPYGQTWTYGQIAKKLGKPGASRAVGLANGANPVMIVVPCHRVIGSTGGLTGFGAGLDAKRWLLNLESTLLFSNTSNFKPT